MAKVRPSMTSKNTLFFRKKKKKIANSGYCNKKAISLRLCNSEPFVDSSAHFLWLFGKMGSLLFEVSTVCPCFWDLTVVILLYLPFSFFMRVRQTYIKVNVMVIDLLLFLVCFFSNDKKICRRPSKKVK